MTAPSPEQLQREIAKRLGWTHLHVVNGRLGGIPPDSVIPIHCPNWPTDRNASYELPVEDGDRQLYERAYNDIGKNFAHPFSAYNESLAWLLYKGWRWDDCLICGGDGILHDYTCEKCKGEGGEWEKEG